MDTTAGLFKSSYLPSFKTLFCRSSENRPPCRLYPIIFVPGQLPEKHKEFYPPPGSCHIFLYFNISDESTTETELKAIAALASIGFSNNPFTGNNTPAARGIPITL